MGVCGCLTCGSLGTLDYGCLGTNDEATQFTYTLSCWCPGTLDYGCLGSLDYEEEEDEEALSPKEVGSQARAEVGAAV